MKKIRIYVISFQVFLVSSIFAFAFFTACSKENLVDSTSVNAGDEEPGSEISATSGGAYGQQMVPPVNTSATAHFSGTYEHGPNKWNFDISWLGFHSPATAIEVRGPAEWGQNGHLVFTFPVDAATEGKDYFQVTLTDAQATNLLSNKYYYLVKTEAYPAGEIRGQIIRNAR